MEQEPITLPPSLSLDAARTYFQVRLAEDGTVLATGYSNVLSPENTEIDEATFKRVDGRAHQVRLVDGEVVDLPPPDPPPTGIVQVSAAQAKVALLDHGIVAGTLTLNATPNLLDQTEAVITAYNDRRIKLWFDNAQVWERENPYVLGIGLELGLTDEQMDELFAYAATLSQ